MPPETSSHQDLSKINHAYLEQYQHRQVILTFEEYLELAKKQPRQFTRNSVRYLLDAFDHFGWREVEEIKGFPLKRWKIFDLETDRSGSIVGGEVFQNEFYNVLKRFEANNATTQLVMFHGPNGSAKSSTVEALAKALSLYSHTDEGAVYRFNWVFPIDKGSLPSSAGESGTIGFGGLEQADSAETGSFAKLSDQKIKAKLISEFKENPLFLLPMPYRETFLRQAFDKQGLEEQSIPPHILASGMAKKNIMIFEALLNAYGGSLEQVFRHIQVERFFFSKQYRVGISTVDPQLPIDAREKQLTLDSSYSNLPSALQTISFHDVSGELVESNRGLLEFSDLLKRPPEGFKYLLSTIEQSAVTLPSGTVNLDTIFVATSNEKHLDAFKTIPDFSSFKARFELIKMPYLRLPKLEERIYTKDLELIRKTKRITPHVVELLSTWAVLTRLKQPDPNSYPEKYRQLITKLDPLSKVNFYQSEPLQPKFTRSEQLSLEEIRENIWTESQKTSIYEGRFGASPREIKAVLYRASQHEGNDVTPMDIFEEITALMKDRTVYEFLQIQPREKYHHVEYFLSALKAKFMSDFERELVESMNLAAEDEYESLLSRYVNQVVAEVKKEKIWDEITNSYVQPSPSFMNNIETIIKAASNREEHRQSLLNRLASFKIENPDDEISIATLFADYLELIKKHFYQERQQLIAKNTQAMLDIAESEAGPEFDDELEANVEETFRKLEDIGYSREAAVACIKFKLRCGSPLPAATPESQTP